MINPDGVLSGNYRTSFVGKDLNRLYMQKDTSSKDGLPVIIEKLLIPEISSVKHLIMQNKKNLLAFIDVHHHC